MDNVTKADTIYSDVGLVIYEYRDSLYVAKLDDGKIVTKHVVNKGFSRKQMAAITLTAVVVGIFLQILFRIID